MRTRSLLLLLLLAAPAGLAANDWPQARYDATHSGAVPASLNAEFVPFVARWWGNLSIPGPVGSPAVRENIVYIGDVNGRLYAFDQESGGLLWSNSTTTSRISGTPAVGQDFVYVLTESGSIYSFDRKTGTAQPGFPLSAGPSFGSVLLHEDILYVGATNGAVTSYFASTRQQRWTFSVGGSFFNNTVKCDPGSIDGTPVIFEKWVMFGATNHCFYAVDKSAFGSISEGAAEPKNKPIWAFVAGESIRSTPAVDPTTRRVIFGDVGGKVYAVPVDSAGAATAAWTYTEPLTSGVTSEVKSSPAIAGANVIVAARNGNVRALSASGGAVVWTRNVNGEVTSSPAVANGRVLVGSFDRNMYMLSLADGNVSDTRLALGEVESSPAISGTQGIWASKDGTLYSWGGRKPDRADLAVISFTPPGLVVGVPTTLHAAVRNTGVLPSTATTATFSSGTTTLAEIPLPALTPGQDFDAAAPYTPGAAGAVTFRILLDSTRTVRESDEANNEATATANVVAPPPTPTEETTEGKPAPGAGVALMAVAAAVTLALAARRRR